MSSTTPKKYHLTEGEIKNIKFRRTVMDYIADIINNDTGRFVYTDVRTRLNIAPEVELQLSEDGEWLIEVPPKPQILKP